FSPEERASYVHEAQVRLQRGLTGKELPWPMRTLLLVVDAAHELDIQTYRHELDLLTRRSIEPVDFSVLETKLAALRRHDPQDPSLARLESQYARLRQEIEYVSSTREQLTLDPVTLD